MGSPGDLTLGDVVSDNAVRFGDVGAHRHGDRTVTHAQLRDRAVRLVSAMAAAGVRRQDRIAVLSGNGIEFVYLHGSRELIASRLNARQGHFMPPTRSSTRCCAASRRRCPGRWR